MKNPHLRWGEVLTIVSAALVRRYGDTSIYITELVNNITIKNSDF